jgi:citrate lyase subunit beta/citryl-CoA lyase
VSPEPEPLTALYVPGDRPERFDKAIASGADVVIVDLEDAVGPAAKVAARRHVVEWLNLRSGDHPGVQVRVNVLHTDEGQADVRALPPDVELRVPKVDRVEDLTVVRGRAVHALLESAAGVEHAYDIARHPGVRTLTLGEADLQAELGTSGDEAMTWMRSRLVVAARAAGLPAPMMSAYPAIADLDGLARSCERGKQLGMRGRTAIHPSQVSVIRAAFESSAAEQAWARAVLEALAATGGGAATLPDGSMVDEAMARSARGILGIT